MVEGDIDASEIPQELIDIIDLRAGKLHSRTGSVLTTLAEVLTRWEELKKEETCTQESQ